MAAEEDLVEVTVWVLLDADGDYVRVTDPDLLSERYEAEVAELDAAVAKRVLKLSVTVPKPRPVVLTARVGDEPAAGELRVA